MSGGWSGSDRRGRLPANWPQIRLAVLARDNYRCTKVRSGTGRRCGAPATDVDHVVPGDDHRMENLTSLCGWHHRQKSSQEGAQAKQDRRASAKRPQQKHPGER